MDSSSNFAGSLPEVVKSIMMGYHTVSIGEVQKFDKGPPAQVEVQCVIKRRYRGEKEAQMIEPLVQVPVIYTGSGDYWARFPLEKGSAVILLFNERSIQDWFAQGGIVDPTKKRCFDLSDAMALPGVLPDPDNDVVVPDNGIEVGKKDGSIAVSVSDEGVTTKVGETVSVAASTSGVTTTVAGMDFEITATGAKAKPTTGPVLTDVQAYSPVGPPPGYVSLATHTHLSSAPGVASGPPIPVPGPP